MPVVEAEPYPVELQPSRTAYLIIDMQRDFLEPGGFGETLGNDVAQLRPALAPCRAMLDEARARGMLVIHTREGHRADLSRRAAGQARARQARVRGSATPARWAASWSAASPATTSCPSSTRCRASR